MATGRTRKARPRKRHEQLELLNKGGTGKARKQRAVRRRRGKAQEAPKRIGRPPKGPRSSERHERRPTITARDPVHVVLRVEEAVRPLRRAKMYRAVRGATMVVAARKGFGIVHVSIQGTHIHLLAEAENKTVLARGMQAFQISAAKRMNAAVARVDAATEEKTRRRGKVFSDRYHAEVIKNPRQARHALAYVLNNWRKHRADAGESFRVDPYSTGVLFRGWKAFEQPGFALFTPKGYESLVVAAPRSWLLRVGWMRYGRIDFREVPSARATPASGGGRAKSEAPRPYAVVAEG